MRAVGYVALGFFGAGVAVGVGLVISSLPDLSRYLRLRRM
jgi:hypothetical protein